MTTQAGLSLTVDGRPVAVGDGATVLDAVLAAGVELPHLCKDEDGPALGACRTCLVEVEGVRGLPASCSLPASQGMVVRTATDVATRARRGVLELTLGMRDAAADPLPGSDLSRAAVTHAADARRWPPRVNAARDDSNPFYLFDAAECILCGRCTSACQDRQSIGAIGIAGSGGAARIAAFADEPLGESICTSCGQCVAACPTGAIRPKREPAPARTVSTVCPYCGVGCGIKLSADEAGRITHVDDDPANRSSTGLLCVKGRFGVSFVDHPDRLTTPLVRRGGRLEPAGWDEALDLVADKFVQHRGRFGAFASAKATNEDNYLIQKFTRTLMATNNVDHCTRLCHSPSVEAMLAQLGSGATSNSYTDYEDAGCVFVVGADPSSNHPVIASRIRRAAEEHGVRLIVLDPRRVEFCDHTDLWLRPYPGTDVAVLNGMARVILDEGLQNDAFIRDRTEGFDAWRAELEAYTPEHVEDLSGVPADLLRRAARLYARPAENGGPPGRDGSCLLWGMGVTQHINGTDNATAVLNLALLAGQVGRAGTGVSPLRGQNNVQGAGDAGCVPNTLPGYQDYTPANLARFEGAWGSALTAEEGMRATDMVEAIAQGDIRCMYIVGENPALTDPNLAHATELLRSLDFLVVQDLFMHETTEIADVVLPAASFAEKEGTFTNSERRVQRVRKLVEPPGAARADWEIVQDLAERVAARPGDGSPVRDLRGFDHPSAASIFDELASLTPTLGGLSHARLDAEGGIQWPCPSPGHPGTARLYADDFPRGRGRFVPVRQTAPADEQPDDRYPLILNTGRVLYHWHGGTLTRRVEGLEASFPELRVAVNPADAAALEIADGEAVQVRSRRGRLEGVAFLTEDVAPGALFVPFVRLRESAANWLTNSVYEEASRIPEFKVCTVSLEPAIEPREWGDADARSGAPRRRGKRRQHW
ncbi:MAG: formate dehydrogenase subunit alpha [Chloroflexi bacterium]|nr:formate dehydrogenase subunit alpha [Chloroflexota bacterium]